MALVCDGVWCFRWAPHLKRRLSAQIWVSLSSLYQKQQPWYRINLTWPCDGQVSLIHAAEEGQARLSPQNPRPG